MDPYPPPRRVRIDTGMAIEVQHEGVVWVDEVVHPVFLVGLAPPGPGQSAGPKSIPLKIGSDGQQNVVEASAATISGRVGEYQDYGNLVGRAYAPFANPSTYVAGSTSRMAPLRLAVTLTATAGGEITIVPIVPALAGYKACCVITGLWSDQTDVSIVMAITTTSGLTFGPASWDWATVAAQLTDYHQGVAFKGSAVLEGINVACAAGQAGADQVIQVIGYYWYEAT